MPTIEIVIPVQNLAEQIAACVNPLLRQLEPGDRVTVVDDASTDDTAQTAERLGVNVIQLPASRGPYYARQVAADASTADMLLFVDGRCRALPGLLAAHRRMLTDPGVALTCTETLTVSGPTAAQRLAARQQPFSLAGKIGVDGRLDFFPTANLGVRRSAFLGVGGFRAMRSGADADLCWRVQKADLGRLAADPTVLMEWVPRAALRDLLEQWYRYGKSTAYLEWVHPDQSPSSSGRSVSLVERIMSGNRPSALLPALAYQCGVRRGHREPQTAPTSY
jgi:glycosyltransferase involved in cell wall biosynthesis